MKIAVSSVTNQDISHNIALTLGAMSAMNMVPLSWTVHTEYFLQELQQHITNQTRVTTPDQLQGTTVKIGTDGVNPDHSLTTERITAQVIIYCIEATLDHNTGVDAATTGAVHDDLTQPTETTATDPTMPHHIIHIADHLHIKVLQVINPEIVVGHIHNHPTDPQGMNHADQVHTPAG